MTEKPIDHRIHPNNKVCWLAIISLVFGLISWGSFFISLFIFYFYYFDISYRAPWWVSGTTAAIIPGISSLIGLFLGVFAIVNTKNDKRFMRLGISIAGVVIGAIGTLSFVFFPILVSLVSST
jgi:hypothetical protein